MLCCSHSRQSTNLMAACCMFQSAVNWPKWNFHHVNNFTGSSVWDKFLHSLHISIFCAWWIPVAFGGMFDRNYIAFELGKSIQKLVLFPFLPFESCSIFPQFEWKFVTEILFQVCYFLFTQTSQLEQHTLMCSIFLTSIRCIKCIQDQWMPLNFIDVLLLYCA